MRTHGDYALCQLWRYGPAERAIVATGAVAIARFETIQHASRTWGWLDLTFERAGAAMPVCGILVDVLALARNDASALIFPRTAAAAIDLRRADELTEFLLPHLVMLTRARVLPLEEVLRFEPSATFERARTAGELGAAPLATALARMAPWVAAARAAGPGPMDVRAADGALAAAVARRFGVALTAASTIEGDDWYRIAPGTHDGEPEIGVAETFPEAADAPIRVARQATEAEARDALEFAIPQPLPMEAVLTYDPGDAPTVGRFWIAAARRPVVQIPRAIPRPRTARKRLVFLVRDDITTAPDADTDELAELALRARAAGFTVAFAGARDISALDAGMAAVACGALDDAAFVPIVSRLAARGEPFGILAAPAGPEGSPYEAALWRVTGADDDERLERESRAFDARPPEAAAPLDAAAQAQLAEALPMATLLVPAATDGTEPLRRAFGLVRTTLVASGPIVPPDEGDEDVSAICGRGPFVFAHAPAIGRSGLLALALALRDTDIPCAIVTPVADLGYVTELRRFAGPRTIVLTSAKAGMINAFYRHAAIFVDTAIRPRGISRIVRAGRSGALPVAFAASPVAALLAAESVVPRTAIVDLRDTLTRLWQSPVLNNRRGVARAMFAPTLGHQATIDASAEHIMNHFERLCSEGATPAR